MLTRDNYLELAVPFLVSFGLSYGLTPLVMYLAQRFGFVDNPKRQHAAILHSTIIPRAGGVPMFLAFAITGLIFANQDPLFWGLILGSSINVISGTLDDKYDLSPVLRLGVQIISGMIAVAVGVSFYITNPLGEGVLYFDWLIVKLPFFNQPLVVIADLLLVFWCVWLMNMVNWTKGVSQLPGIAVIALITIAAVALKFQAGNPYQWQTATLAVIAAGAVLAFLPFNFPPERMFPGFGGSTFIGYVLAILAVLSGGKIAALLIVLLVPIADGLTVLVKRILTGHNPLINDREHLYHFLLKHIGKNQIILLYWLITLLLSLIAFLTTTYLKILVVVIGSILVLTLYQYFRLRAKLN